MNTRKALSLAVGLLMSLLMVSVALAQSGGGYDLTWWTADGGGSRLTGSSYVLQGTAGQPDAGALNGGGYSLAGGFWTGGANQRQLYLPLILR